MRWLVIASPRTEHCCSNASDAVPAVFHIRDERIDLHTNSADVARLAARLWRAGPPASASPRSPLILTVSVVEGAGTPGAPESLLAWHAREDGFELEAGSALRGILQWDRRQATITLTRGLLAQAAAFVARTALEAPAAAFLARGAFVAIHAASVCGRRGALILRGASGAGKSTLAAAAASQGLHVLGDESVLVARDDADAITASVREVAVRTDVAFLVGLRKSKNFTLDESNEKIRIALPVLHRPDDRTAKRVTTWILGRRDGGPARLLPMTRQAFVQAFREGATPEEEVGGEAVEQVMERWAEGPVWRLEGAADLHGAIERVRATVA